MPRKNRSTGSRRPKKVGKRGRPPLTPTLSRKGRGSKKRGRPKKAAKRGRPKTAIKRGRPKTAGRRGRPPLGRKKRGRPAKQANVSVDKKLNTVVRLMSQAVGILAAIGNTEIGPKRRGRPAKVQPLTPTLSLKGRGGRRGRPRKEAGTSTRVAKAGKALRQGSGRVKKRGRKPSSPLRKAALEILAAGGKMKTKDIVAKVIKDHPEIAKKYKNLYINVNQILVSAAKKVGRGTWKSA